MARTQYEKFADADIIADTYPYYDACHMAGGMATTGEVRLEQPDPEPGLADTSDFGNPTHQELFVHGAEFDQCR